jgi:isoquinoline 1-oxidoreductase subunit beta
VRRFLKIGSLISFDQDRKDLVWHDVTSTEGGRVLPYSFPNFRMEYTQKETGVPIGFWRSVGNSFNGFVTECFFDEIAAAAKKDPYELRRSMLTEEPRHAGVLTLAAEKAGWGTPLPPGRSRGIAMHESFGSIVAMVAEVSVAPDGEVQVHRVVTAIDCGPVVNPSILEAQMESGIVYGLSAALHGKITIENGRVKQTNFHDYAPLRMKAMPVCETHIVPSKAKMGGAGECSVPVIAPAVCNAIFAATGKRIRSLPIDTSLLARSP